MTKIDAIHSRQGQTLYHKTQRNADKSPTRVVVTGPCKTWRSNDNFMLPVRSGRFNNFYITPSNAHQWSMIVPGAVMPRITQNANLNIGGASARVAVAV